MMIELLKKSLNLLLFIFLFSCSVSAPIIREHDWDITIIEDKKNNLVYEQLSIFVNCYDEDGENDIETIFFINDEDGLYWELNDETWDIKLIDKVKWLGSSSIVMPDRSNIPRTSLRIFVRDLSGESVEDKIFITKRRIDFDNFILPELEINNGNYSLKNYENAIIKIVFDNKVLAEGDLTETPQTFFDIFALNREEYDKDIEYFLIINKKDLNLKSGPWYEF